MPRRRLALPGGAPLAALPLSVLLSLACAAGGQLAPSAEPPAPGAAAPRAPARDEGVARLTAARARAQAAEARQAWPEAARARAELAELAPAAERAREAAAALAIVDEHLAPAEVLALAGEVQPESPLAPGLALRAARARLQGGDVAGAEAAARDVAARFAGTPEAAEAGVLLGQLANRAPVDPRLIGVAVPLSGRQKAWGEAILQGVALALGDESPYRLSVIDTRGEAAGARAALEQLVLKEGAVAALGGVAAAEAEVAARTAQEQGLPFISLSRVAGVTSAGPFVFRTMLTAEAQARALAELTMARRGLRRFGLLWPQIPYGQELAHAFWDEVEGRGGEVRAAEGYAPDRTTFGPLVKGMVGKLWLDERQEYRDGLEAIALQELDPYRRRKAVERLRAQVPPVVDFEAVFIPDFAKGVALVAPALAVEDVVTATCDPRELERIGKVTGREVVPVQLLGANGWDDPTLVERAGRYVECALFVDGFYAASQRPATRAFTEAFQARFERPPTILEATAFDATALLRKALAGGAVTRDALRATLAAVRGFAGATGDLAFDDRREVEKPLFFLTVERGVVRELTPAERAGKPPG